MGFRSWENIDFTLDSGKYIVEVYVEVCIIYLIVQSEKKLRAFKKLTLDLSQY